MKTGSRATPGPGVARVTARGDFRLEDFLPYQLSVAANRVSRLFARRYSGAYGLTIPEWRVLATIARFGTVSPTAVCEWTAMDKVKVSRAAAALVARGLIRQSPDPQRWPRPLAAHDAQRGDGASGRRAAGAVVGSTLAEGLGRGQWAALSKALVRLNAHVQNIEGADHGEAVD